MQRRGKSWTIFRVAPPQAMQARPAAPVWLTPGSPRPHKLSIEPGPATHGLPAGQASAGRVLGCSWHSEGECSPLLLVGEGGPRLRASDAAPRLALGTGRRASCQHTPWNKDGPHARGFSLTRITRTEQRHRGLRDRGDNGFVISMHDYLFFHGYNVILMTCNRLMVFSGRGTLLECGNKCRGPVLRLVIPKTAGTLRA
jgi:hypothetical protein